MLKVFLTDVTNMSQTIKTAVLTFGGLLSFSLILFGWKAYEQGRKEAELRQFCENLAQYTSIVRQRGHEASDAELMAGVYAQSLSNYNCQKLRN